MRHSRHTTVIILAGVLQSGASGAQCPEMTVHGVNRSVYDAITDLGLHPEQFLEFAENHVSRYNMDAENGWDSTRSISQPLNIGREYNRHLLGAYLVGHGVAKQDPVVAAQEHTLSAMFTALGLPGEFYGYQPQELLISFAFHASSHEYGPLILAARTPTCNEINPRTGNRNCQQTSSVPFLAAIQSTATPDTAYWHAAYSSHAANEQSSGSSTGGNSRLKLEEGISWVEGSQDPFELWRIIYYCPSIGGQADAVLTALTQVHEASHLVTRLRHNPDAEGLCPGDCDVWVDVDEVQEFAGLVKHREMAPYQLNHRFTCDLTESPQDWVPLTAQIAANTWTHTFANRPKWSNIGAAPFSCGVPQAILDSSVGTFCPGTSQLRCDTGADCTQDENCVELCCVPNVIVK